MSRLKRKETMKLDFENLDKMIAEGYINVQKHPDFDLYIHNYSAEVQFGKIWNNETTMCRGLILDGQRNIVARPFRKFLNYEHHINLGGPIPVEDFVITEKMDGSLGILYRGDDGKPYIATRGSFASDQAKKANEILYSKYKDLVTDPIPFDRHMTFLFEIIYKDNRIVVDYGNMEDLVLLSIIQTQSGQEVPYDFVKRWGERWGFPVVKQYDGICDFAELQTHPNSEGYVIHWPKSDLRLKLKNEEYCRLHKIVTGVNTRRIWEIMAAGDPLTPLLEAVPDEFYDFVDNTVRELEENFSEIESIAKADYDRLKDIEIQKDFALEALKTKYPQILFTLRKDRNPKAQIWKMIRPELAKPFKSGVCEDV